jgi:hypothetical protein
LGLRLPLFGDSRCRLCAHGFTLGAPIAFGVKELCQGRLLLGRVVLRARAACRERLLHELLQAARTAWRCDRRRRIGRRRWPAGLGTAGGAGDGLRDALGLQFDLRQLAHPRGPRLRLLRSAVQHGIELLVAGRDRPAQHT